jgi:uncharacterized membrane protein
MTDTATTPPPVAPQAGALSEDRTLPAVVYVLYLLGHVLALPFFIGVVIAYASMGSAGPKMYSHYLFQVRTLWTALGWAAIGFALIIVGIPLSVVLIGIPLIIIGGCILAAGWLWILLRCIVGIIHLANDEAYPRPRSWLV